MPCFSEPEVEQAHARIALQQSLGLDVEWLSGSDIDGRDTGLAPGSPSAPPMRRVTATSTHRETCWRIPPR